MTLLEMTPFVRFAMQFEHLPMAGTYTSQDSRLFYVTRGSGKIYLNDVAFSFSKGSVLLWQAGTKYRFDCDSKIEVICINFDYTTENSAVTNYYAPILLKNTNADLSHIKKHYFTDCEWLNKPIVCHNAFSLEKNLSNIVLEHISKTNYYVEKSSAALKGTIVNILRNFTQNTTSSDKIKRVIEHIKENYATELSNESLAELVDYHPYYLNRIFLKAKGVTLHQYIINYRITMAEQLLLSTDTSIMEISQKVGFSSLSLFIINFKKKNILTPSQFRKSRSSI